MLDTTHRNSGWSCLIPDVLYSHYVNFVSRSIHTRAYLLGTPDYTRNAREPIRMPSCCETPVGTTAAMHSMLQCSGHQPQESGPFIDELSNVHISYRCVYQALAQIVSPNQTLRSGYTTAPFGCHKCTCIIIVTRCIQMQSRDSCGSLALRRWHLVCTALHTASA
jgi:hypothetical protein